MAAGRWTTRTGMLRGRRGAGWGGRGNFREKLPLGFCLKTSKRSEFSHTGNIHRALIILRRPAGAFARVLLRDLKSGGGKA